MTSTMIWAVAVSAMSWEFSAVTKYMMLPTYIAEVLQVNIVQNGWFTTIPMVFFIIVKSVAAIVSDKLIQHGVKVIRVRKLMWGTGFIISAAIGCSVGYLNANNLVLVVVVMTLWSGLAGIVTSSAYIALAEYAPAYAGLTTSLIKIVGQIGGFCAPIVIKSLTPDGTQGQWRIVFFLAGAVKLLGALVFIVFGQSGVPEWAKQDAQNEKISLLSNAKDNEDTQTSSKEDCP